MDHVANTLAIVCSVGGIIGYIKKGSVASLVGGVAVGAVYGYAGYLLHENANYGIETALVASGLLTAETLKRAVRTAKPLPISLATAGAASFVYYGAKWREFNA